MAVAALVLGLGAAVVGAELSKIPASYVDGTGVVVDVERIGSGGESGDRWDKTIDVTDGSGASWRFVYRDAHHYDVGDPIVVRYDPAEPADTLVTGDHEFAPPWATLIGIVGFTTMSMLAVGIGIGEVVERIRSRRR